MIKSVAVKFMKTALVLDQIHARAKRNRWLWLFSVFCRVVLAAGFIPAGIVKLMDERFASGLDVNHPMGHYLEALHLTGFYYTFIGAAQLLAAIMLLVPRTATLGAFLYFPIIFNITVLTYATRFDGSLFTAPLMTLANLYILGWNYEKWKYILPFNEVTEQKKSKSALQTRKSDGRQSSAANSLRSLYTYFQTVFRQLFSDRFPTLFFAGVFAAVFLFVIVIPNLYSIKPRNSFSACIKQFNNSKRSRAGEDFCRCVHKNGEPLGECLDKYEKSADDDFAAP